MFRPLRIILKERVKKYSFTDELLTAEVLKFWQEFIKEELGPEFMNKARALYFKKGILTIKVSHSNLVEKLKPKEADVVKKINNLLQRNFINPQKLKKITYKIDAL